MARAGRSRARQPSTERAEEAARQGLTARPGNVPLLVRHARALDALDRRRDARTQLDAALRVNPGNDEALRVRRALRPERLFTFGAGFGSEKLSDDSLPWRETSFEIGYHTPAGLLVAHRTRAERPGVQDDRYEVEMSPAFRQGTRAHVAVAYAPDAALFPEMRYAADIYQGVGGGVELSLGARRLEFADDLHVFTAALNKYHGNWLLSARTYYTQDTPGTAASYQIGVRRTYGPGGGSAFGLRYARGSARDEIRDVADLDVIDADVLYGEMDSSVTRWLGISTRASYGRERLTSGGELRRLSVTSGVRLRF